MTEIRIVFEFIHDYLFYYFKKNKRIVYLGITTSNKKRTISKKKKKIAIDTWEMSIISLHMKILYVIIYI